MQRIIYNYEEYYVARYTATLDSMEKGQGIKEKRQKTRTNDKVKRNRDKEKIEM